MSLDHLKIATRDSTLALWQTNAVKASLEKLGFPCALTPLKTLGDIDLVSPIYAMGVQGVFTRELDSALLSGQADLAVHSLKDVPTILPKGLVIAAVLERASAVDVLIHKPDFDPKKNSIIATSSIRRKSQWLHRYPHHTLVNVRGNVETRLKKFEAEKWDGIIFAKAGLERLNLLPANFQTLDWMLPAPAQGAIAVVCRELDRRAIEACHQINHHESELRVTIERSFLFHLEGGCSVPISAFATVEDKRIKFKGLVSSLDGKRDAFAEIVTSMDEWKELGRAAAEEIKHSANGAEILAEFRTLNRNS